MTDSDSISERFAKVSRDFHDASAFIAEHLDMLVRSADGNDGNFEKLSSSIDKQRLQLGSR